MKKGTKLLLFIVVLVGVILYFQREHFISTGGYVLIAIGIIFIVLFFVLPLIAVSTYQTAYVDPISHK